MRFMSFDHHIFPNLQSPNKPSIDSQYIKLKEREISAQMYLKSEFSKKKKKWLQRELGVIGKKNVFEI